MVKRVEPPFTLKINSDTLSSASLWDSTGWFIGWIGCKTLKYKSHKRLFWNQIESRLSLKDELLESLSYNSSRNFDCDIEDKIRILDLVKQYGLNAEQLKIVFEYLTETDGRNIHRIIANYDSENAIRKN